VVELDAAEDGRFSATEEKDIFEAIAAEAVDAE